MSGHYHGQGTRKSSPNKGPMKATIPITSVFKTPTIKTNNSSPISCWKSRISPDHPSGQRSPGKSKGSSSSSGNEMRRTASLDAIYLKGQWPQDFNYMFGSCLQIDKATQTDELDIVTGLADTRKIHSIIEDEKLEKLLIRQRLQRTASKESNGKCIGGLILSSAGSQTNSSYMSTPVVVKANPISIPIKALPKQTIRNSVEGLNQEIERLVLKNMGMSGSSFADRYEFDKLCQVTPEGHRAPIAELFKATRSVNTQTPAGVDYSNSCSSSGPPSRNSPLTPGHFDSSSEAGESQNSSPDQEIYKFGSSPHINKFLAREPPDGCERVFLKSLDEHTNLMVDRSPRPCTFQLKPSLGSAFQLLQPLSSDQDLPLVPSQQHLN